MIESVDHKFNYPDNFFTHQKEDWERLLKNLNGDDGCLPGMLNLSEMGTGKTPSAIGLADSGGYAKILIACPKTLRLEWRRQILDWTGIDPSISRKGCYRRLEPLFNDLMKKEAFNPFFIVNYETFRTQRHLDILKRYRFDLIILDEAHRLRRPHTGQTRGMRDFLEAHPKSKVLAMTGSPIVNYPADLHTLLCITRPDLYNWDGRSSFENRYSVIRRTRVARCRECRHMQIPYRDSICPKCGGSDLRIFSSKRVAGSQNLEELKELTDPFTIRHTKKEVLPWLPEKYYRNVLLEMPSEQRRVYDQMEKELMVELESGESLTAEGLGQLMRLRQLVVEPRIIGVKAPSAKTEFLMDLINDLGGEKLVVYSTFDMEIKYLTMTQELPKYIVIDGNTPSDERVPLAQKFCEDDSIKICFATIGANSPGGEGITLTAASNVVFMDRWWTPAANHQAEDRLHRITQQNKVQVIIPTVENSIDQSFDKILEKKDMMAEEFFDDEKAFFNQILDDRRQSIRQGSNEEIDLDDDSEGKEENGDSDEE